MRLFAQYKKQIESDQVTLLKKAYQAGDRLVVIYINWVSHFVSHWGLNNDKPLDLNSVLLTHCDFLSLIPMCCYFYQAAAEHDASFV
jgi:hypothetical protein